MGVENTESNGNKGKTKMEKPSPRMQIRNLPYRIYRELSRLLDTPGDKDWKAFVSVLPDGMYARKQVEALEDVARKKGSPAEELLRDLGFQLVTVRELIGYLSKINHQEALLLLKPNEPVEIIKQPKSESVCEGEIIRLSCAAKGFPKPSYQWFKVGVGEVEIGFEKELCFDKVCLEDTGEYYCKITNDSSSASTIPVHLQVIPTVREPIIPENGVLQVGNAMERLGHTSNALRNDALEPMNIYPGQYFVLSCGMDDLPNVNYYWLKNGREIPGENRPKLIFNPFCPEDEGYYSCRVVGQDGDMLTKLMHLKSGGAELENRQIATGKVALVIGNQHYINKRPPYLELEHPVDDARTLGLVLRDMGYRVICLVDLDLTEMQKAINGFCDMLKMSPGMYGVFYFGGHGYEESGRTYLVPVDAPSQWNSECTICADTVLSQMQESKTKLNVLFLDVCRTPSGSDPQGNAASSFDPYFKAGAQSVICYATCPQSQAFERRSDRNGIYMKHLIRHIHDDMRIENVVHKVHCAVSQETEKDVLTKTMSPTYTTSTTKEFRLLDPVLHDFEGDPTEKWFQHHRLPSSQIVTFQNGIRAKLSFGTICSNLCQLILHVEDIGSTSECDVRLFDISTDFSVVKESMNVIYNLNNDLLSRSNPKSQSPKGKSLNYERRTNLPNLQKILSRVMLTLEAVYKVDEKERKENKMIVIEHTEFGITALFV